MKRALLAIPSLSLVAGLAALAASCGAPSEPVHMPPPVKLATPTAEPATTTSAAPSAQAVDLRDPGNVDFVSWTDDGAIEALAQDCHWDPGGCLKAIETAALTSMDKIDFRPEDEQTPSAGDTRPLPPAMCGPLTPLACASVPGQSCAPDECSQNDYTCVPACDRSCSDCAGKCAAACESCKSGCKDDACKRACARSCGECRQGCLKALDHCTSAGCSEEMESCFKTRDDEWTKSACDKVCSRVAECVGKCPDVEHAPSYERYESECAKKCLSKHGKGCPARFDHICAGDPDASVNFFIYRQNRQKKSP